MTRPIEPLAEIIKDWSKKHLPVLYRGLMRLQDWKALAMSWLAHYSRRFASGVVIVVGLLSTLYALYLFAFESLAPDKPKPSHDVILKKRFSSPAPSASIVIIDIDERSLAMLAPEYGRWPWSRQVLAEALDKLATAEVRSVIFNVLISDPDKNNPDGDAALAFTAQMVRPVAFPMVRLNPENDAASQLKVADIPGVKTLADFKRDTTIAAVLPLFPGMQDRMGVANPKPDEDGIVRKYPLQWSEKGYVLPSMVGRALELAGEQARTQNATISLNWRNKQGRYQRISFSDLYLNELNETQLMTLKNSDVIIGVSAPGLGQIRPTSVSVAEDDSEILATALDDALNDTHLRTMPAWMVLILNVIAIWTLVFMSTRSIQNQTINRLFILAQSTFGGVTLLSASYTPYLIDLSDSMSFGLAVFAAMKVVQGLEDRWSRAKPGYRRSRRGSEVGEVWALGLRSSVLPSAAARQLQREVESVVGLQSVVRLDDLFGGESFIKAACADFQCLLILVSRPHRERIQEILANDRYATCHVRQFELSQPWDLESKTLAAEVTPWVLEMAADTLRPT